MLLPPGTLPGPFSSTDSSPGRPLPSASAGLALLARRPADRDLSMLPAPASRSAPQRPLLGSTLALSECQPLPHSPDLTAGNYPPWEVLWCPLGGASPLGVWGRSQGWVGALRQGRVHDLTNCVMLLCRAERTGGGPAPSLADPGSDQPRRTGEGASAAICYPHAPSQHEDNHLITAVPASCWPLWMAYVCRVSPTVPGTQRYTTDRTTK